MDNRTDTCFKCGKTLPLDEFYTHSRMENGHLGKCKSCTRADTKKRTDALKLNPEWIEKEKARCREKEKRLRWKRHKPTTEKNRERLRKYRERFPEKYQASILASSIPKDKGTNNHHWSYNKSHAKDVIPLTIENHAIVHRHMIYDQERMMYRRLDGTLIDSRESAIEYYESLKEFKPNDKQTN